MDQHDTNPAARPLPRSVYAITEREGRASIWTRIGGAWNNKDGSITVRLDALPVSGILQVRDVEDRRENGGAR
ncbi:MAG: hypothetical protein U0324_14750 [Polyangiales bacterium]